MTLIAYDTEFLEDGETIQLISIGMVADDGREYYAVNEALPSTRIWDNEWLVDNVWKHLPVKNLQTVRTGTGKIVVSDPGKIDRESEFVKPRWVIRNEVRAFIRNSPDPQLWADYGAYDHVVLAQLFGKMIDLPEGIPMHTNDLQTLLSLRLADEPAQVGTGHNALDDARTVMSALQFLLAPPSPVVPPSTEDLAKAAGEGVMFVPDPEDR